MKNMIAALILIMTVTPAMAEKSAREKAKKMYTSLTGVQPNRDELNYLSTLIESGSIADLEKAGHEIVDQKKSVIKNGGAFYGVTLKDWITPKLNKQKTTLAPLNDTSATVIGMVRDNVPFNKILYENVVYKALGVTFKGEAWYFRHNSSNMGSNTFYPSAPALPAGKTLTSLCGSANGKWKIIHNNPQRPNDINDKSCRETKYTQQELSDAYDITSLYLPHLDTIIETNLLSTTNRHYEHISELGLDLGDPSLLGATKQDTKLHAHSEAIAGILSQRGFGSAYYFAGTNRAPIAYVMEHFMCKDMEALHDNTVPDFRNRRDVDRSPGGNSDLYKNRCIGCHAGMDALSGAFAYYDYDQGKVKYTPGVVVTKMNHNDLFPEGFVTTDDSWKNLWVNGNNAALGWGSVTEGNGAYSLGRTLAFTEAFHSCMALQAYEKVCMKKVTSALDKSRVAKLTNLYKNRVYNMKDLFIHASIACLED